MNTKTTKNEAAWGNETGLPWLEIDGTLHGFTGTEIVVVNAKKRGSFRIGHVAWIRESNFKNTRVDMGYTHWLPLNMP